MTKRNHYELMAASARAQMRGHALDWRAGKGDPYAGMISKEQRDESLATNLMCAKSYRDNSHDYARMGRQQRADDEADALRKLTQAVAPDGPDRVLINGEPVTCPRCNQEIDPHVCYCGDPMEGGNHQGHTPTPIGCRCGFPKKQIDDVPF